MGDSGNDLKDVACVVLSQMSHRDCTFIYFIDIITQKLRGFVELDGEGYSCSTAYVVYKRMLYGFGGMMRTDPGNKVGCNNACALDLVEVAKSFNISNSIKKPMAVEFVELPGMNSGKYAPYAVVVGHKICVFDKILGHRPADCNFEIFDPREKTWVTVQDPFLFKPGHFVEESFVEDDKLFVSFRDKGIYELNLGGTSPFWVRHKLFRGVKFLPFSAYGVKIGSIVLTVNVAHNLANGHAFAHRIVTTRSGETAEKRYDVHWKFGEPIFLVGPTKVCTVEAVFARKRTKSKDASGSKISSKGASGSKISSKGASGSKFSDMVLRKCDNKKDSFIRLLVNVYDVDPAARPIELKVVRSFMVRGPIDDRFMTGSFRAYSLCDA